MKSWNWQMGTGTQAHDRVYDAYGRLVRYRMGPYVRDLGYDAANRITSYTHYAAVSAASVPALDQSFGYDELGRLTSVVTSTASWSIGYDANGNRTGVSLNGTASTYTTASTSNRLTSTTNPARSFGYDSAGNTTSDSYTATYSLAGRLATLLKAGVTTTYAVDGFGRRVRKFSSSGASSTVLFVYDSQGHLLGEYNNAGTALREYVWLGDTPLAVFTPNGTNPPSVFYIHTDHLNTPRVVLNTSAQQRWSWLAEPFGTTAPNTNPASLGAFAFNLRHPGQYADSESGLFYNYFRDYDASIGRYAQSDPIGLAGGIDPYVYVENQPTMRRDPDGLQPIPIPLPPILPPPVIPRPDLPPPAPNYTPNPRPDLGALCRVAPLMCAAAVLPQILPKENCPPSADDCRKRKQQCFAECQYELDFPGRTGHDNMLRFRACVRRCMNAAGCDY